MTSRNTRRILSTVAVMAALGAAVLAEGGTVLAWDGPPQITPLCSGGPNAATDYEWEVTFGQVESNYNVDYSPTGLPGSWYRVTTTTTTLPYDLETPRSLESAQQTCRSA